MRKLVFLNVFQIVPNKPFRNFSWYYEKNAILFLRNHEKIWHSNDIIRTYQKQVIDLNNKVFQLSEPNVFWLFEMIGCWVEIVPGNDNLDSRIFIGSISTICPWWPPIEYPYYAIYLLGGKICWHNIMSVFQLVLLDICFR